MERDFQGPEKPAFKGRDGERRPRYDDRGPRPPRRFDDRERGPGRRPGDRGDRFRHREGDRLPPGRAALDRHPSIWNPDNSGKLRELCRQALSEGREPDYAEIGRQLDVDPEACRSKWEKWDSQPDWTFEEERRLRDYWEDLNARDDRFEEIARRFEGRRSLAGIQAKLVALSRAGRLIPPYRQNGPNEVKNVCSDFMDRARDAFKAGTPEKAQDFLNWIERNLPRLRDAAAGAGQGQGITDAVGGDGMLEDNEAVGQQ